MPASRSSARYSRIITWAAVDPAGGPGDDVLGQRRDAALVTGDVAPNGARRPELR